MCQHLLQVSTIHVKQNACMAFKKEESSKVKSSKDVGLVQKG